MLLLLIMIAGVAFAQTAPESLARGTNQLGFWAGYSPDNPTLIGTTTNRPSFELNAQYARVVVNGDSWALKYTVDLVPVFLISQPRQTLVTRGGLLFLVDAPGTKRNIYGGGISPIGLQVNFRRHHRLQPYLNGSVGVLYFTDQVPVAGSSQFNFNVGWGAGVEIWHRENQSISLGYRFNHISNANTSNSNPGVDSNIFYGGYAWSWNH